MDVNEAAEQLIDVHRGWCNFCKGNVEWCRNAPPGGCSVPALEAALRASPLAREAEPVAWVCKGFGLLWRQDAQPNECRWHATQDYECHGEPPHIVMRLYAAPQPTAEAMREQEIYEPVGWVLNNYLYRAQQLDDAGFGDPYPGQYQVYRKANSERALPLAAQPEGK